MTKTELLALADEKPTSINDDLYAWATQAAAVLREFAEMLDQKPVAWGWQLPDGKITMLFSEPHHNPDIATVALYIHPPAPQRVPLSEKEILVAAGRLPGWLRYHEELDADDLIDFARQIEAAHNIGEKE